MILNPVGSTATVHEGPSANASNDPAAMQDRFLKLLVAQLNNQDPMNPLDNAQMTTQMAQINTVTGIQTLNLTMQTMAEQFSTMQQIQGISMIGRSVLTEGDRLAVSDKGEGSGAFELAGAATSVKVEVLTPGGLVVDTLELGAQDKGRHDFQWDAGKYSGDTSDLRFRVTAGNKDSAVAATPLMQSQVVATGSANGQFTLTLGGGETVNYANVRGVL